MHTPANPGMQADLCTSGFELIIFKSTEYFAVVSGSRGWLFAYLELSGLTIWGSYWLAVENCSPFGMAGEHLQ